MKKLLVLLLIVLSCESKAWMIENLRDAVIKRDMEITRHQDNETDIRLARRAVRECANDICADRAERRIVRRRNAIIKTRKSFL